MTLMVYYIKINIERKDAMKFKKGLRSLLSFLLLSLLSLILLTGCTQEDVELAADIISAVVETDQKISSEAELEATKDTSQTIENNIETESENEQIINAISEDGIYTSKDEVAEYIHTYGHLPSNFITKKAAKELGWVSNEGNLDKVAPGMSIGGDYFGNYDGLLPESDNRDYYECDIDFDGTYRNAKRIVYSNDGLIYYTEDHYESFELLYGEE